MPPTPFQGWRKESANGRLERPNNRGLWRQTASCNALTTITTKACGRSAWCKQPRGIWSALGVLGVLRRANGRLERPNNRGLWRQTAGCNALTAITTIPCGRSAWCKQPRGIWLQRSNNKCLWPECLVQAAARDLERFRGFRGFTAGKRQAWTP